jgi:hypothetical protein
VPGDPRRRLLLGGESGHRRGVHARDRDLDGIARRLARKDSILRIGMGMSGFCNVRHLHPLPLEKNCSIDRVANAEFLDPVWNL